MTMPMNRTTGMKMKCADVMLAKFMAFAISPFLQDDQTVR